MPEHPYAWLGTVESFLGTPQDEMLRELTRYARETGAPQLFAWDRTLNVMRNELEGCLPRARNFALILEFELPRSGGRRPDLIVLENGTIIVLHAISKCSGVLTRAVSQRPRQAFRLAGIVEVPSSRGSRSERRATSVLVLRRMVRGACGSSPLRVPIGTRHFGIWLPGPGA